MAQLAEPTSRPLTEEEKAALAAQLNASQAVGAQQAYAPAPAPTSTATPPQGGNDVVYTPDSPDPNAGYTIQEAAPAPYRGAAEFNGAEQTAPSGPPPQPSYIPTDSPYRAPSPTSGDANLLFNASNGAASDINRLPAPLPYVDTPVERAPLRAGVSPEREAQIAQEPSYDRLEASRGGADTSPYKPTRLMAIGSAERGAAEFNGSERQRPPVVTNIGSVSTDQLPPGRGRHYVDTDNNSPPSDQPGFNQRMREEGRQPASDINTLPPPYQPSGVETFLRDALGPLGLVNDDATEGAYTPGAPRSDEEELPDDVTTLWNVANNKRGTKPPITAPSGVDSGRLPKNPGRLTQINTKGTMDVGKRPMSVDEARATNPNARIIEPPSTYTPARFGEVGARLQDAGNAARDAAIISGQAGGAALVGTAGMMGAAGISGVGPFHEPPPPKSWQETYQPSQFIGPEPRPAGLTEDTQLPKDATKRASAISQSRTSAPESIGDTIGGRASDFVDWFRSGETVQDAVSGEEEKPTEQPRTDGRSLKGVPLPGATPPTTPGSNMSDPGFAIKGGPYRGSTYPDPDQQTREELDSIQSQGNPLVDKINEVSPQIRGWLRDQGIYLPELAGTEPIPGVVQDAMKTGGEIKDALVTGVMDKTQGVAGKPPRTQWGRGVSTPGQDTTQASAQADDVALSEMLRGYDDDQVAEYIDSGSKSLARTLGEVNVYYTPDGDTPLGWQGADGTFHPAGKDWGLEQFWNEVAGAGGTVPADAGVIVGQGGAAPQGSSPTNQTTNTSPANQSSSTAPSNNAAPRNVASGSGSSGSSGYSDTYTPRSSGSSQGSTSTRGSSMGEMFGDDDEDGLNESDFMDRDWDGDGRVTSKDRSIGRKKFLAAKSSKRKGRKTSTSTIPQRADSPIRTKVLSAIGESQGRSKKGRSA